MSRITAAPPSILAPLPAPAAADWLETEPTEASSTVDRVAVQMAVQAGLQPKGQPTAARAVLAGAAGAAGEPFCSYCKEWEGPLALGAAVVAATMRELVVLAESVEAEEAEEIGSHILTGVLAASVEAQGRVRVLTR